MSHRRWKYDVFLSFRGEDTRNTFTALLYDALKSKGILTFRDDQSLERGKSIRPELLTAIEESRSALVILSPNYATSSWCLDELVKIMRCSKEMGQIVIPVFYKVDPSHVRRQRGSFQLRKVEVKEHEEVYDKPEGLNSLEEWAAALTMVGGIAGLVSEACEDERELIGKIVRNLLKRFRYTSSSVDMGFVGMDSRVDDLLHNYLYPHQDIGGVRIIGIHGMQGIGKTTVAQAIHDEICHDFHQTCFLFNVRESSKKDGGLVALQVKLLSRILMAKIENIDNEYAGATMIERRLRKLKVLVVIDGVDDRKQLQFLAGSRDWFGPGSRIIITTTDSQLLEEHGVDATYTATVLNRDEALQLLSLKAFKRSPPPEDYSKLCDHILEYAQALPLALVVLGAFLFGRSTGEWETAITRLRYIPIGEIIDVLQISFDGLDEKDQEIFLHIACFFKGKDRDRVTQILDYFQLNPRRGLRVLVERSLITVSNNKLSMHDLLQEMGREIVCRQSPNDPGKRSRLWYSKEIIHVLKNNKGSRALQSIALDFPTTEEVRCDPEAFSVMDGLQFLQIRNVLMKEGPRYLSQELMFLEWSVYPTESLPQNFNPIRLCELNLCYSSIERLWSGTKDLPNLKVINVSFSCKLTRTPDFTFAPGLERLILEGCTNLVEIHPSTAELKSLTCLNLKDCRSLKSLPRKIAMESLEILILSGCSKVQRIPEFVGSMECLLEFCLDETAVEQLPLSVGLLTGLTLLNLRDCKNLKRLPSDIGHLKSLKRLNICGCSKLEALPDSLGKIDCLEELDAAGGTSISDIPSSISLLENLEVLSLCGCKGMSGKRTGYPLGFLLPRSDSGGLRSLTELNLSDCNLQEGSIPEHFGCLFSLVSINISKNNFVSLPKSIRQLSKLHNLNLESCKTLLNLPDLSSSLSFSVWAKGGISQGRLSSCFNLINCSKLVVNNQRCNNIALKMLWRFLQGHPSEGNRFETIIPGSEISELFSDQSFGPVVSLELPQQWRKNKWIGYALCAVFVIRRDLPVPANRLGKWKFGTHSTAHGLRCEVKPENLGVAGWCPFFACSQELGQIESEHLWLSFVCGDYFGTTWQETCRNIEFTFKTVGTGMEVKKCGVRLIYEQDFGSVGMK